MTVNISTQARNDAGDAIVDLIDGYDLDTEVIAASIRHPLHVVESARIGAHIATIPYKVLVQMTKHPLTDIGIERFQADYSKIPKPR